MVSDVRAEGGVLLGAEYLVADEADEPRLLIGEVLEDGTVGDARDVHVREALAGRVVRAREGGGGGDGGFVDVEGNAEAGHRLPAQRLGLLGRGGGGGGAEEAGEDLLYAPPGQVRDDYATLWPGPEQLLGVERMAAVTVRFILI